MTCREARDRLSDYLDEGLNATLRRELEQHLDRCAACREEHRLLAATRQLLKTYGAVACPVDFTHLASRMPDRSAARGFSPGFRRPLMVAAAVLALAVGSWQWLRPALEPSRPDGVARQAPRVPFVSGRDVAEVEDLHRSFVVQQAVGTRGGLVLFAPEWVRDGGR
jgi:anti-sigma factor RsiW